MTRSLPADSSAVHWSLHGLLILIFLALCISANSVIKYPIFSKPVLALVLFCYLPLILWNFSANLRTALATLTRPHSLLLLWVLFILSYSWSVIPSVTMNLILTMSAFIVLALFISICYKAEGFDRQLRTAIMLLLILVILYALAVPSSIVSSAGALAFYKQKNNMGVFMGLSVVVLLSVRKRNWWHICFALLACLFLVASRSKTSITVVAVCYIALRLIDWWINKYYVGVRRTNPLSWLYPTVLFGLAALVIFRDQFLNFLWDNLTKTLLTGRGLLWLTEIQHIRSHSLLGIGPGTFWTSEEGRGAEISHTVLYMISPDFIQKLGAGDGSYIDLIASIGVLGLALFFYTVADLYRGLIRNWDQPDSKLIFVLTTFVVVQAITETTILSSGNLLWLIYLLCYFRVAGYTHVSPPLKKYQ